jgi:TIR domain
LHASEKNRCNGISHLGPIFTREIRLYKPKRLERCDLAGVCHFCRKTAASTLAAIGRSTSTAAAGAPDASKSGDAETESFQLAFLLGILPLSEHRSARDRRVMSSLADLQELIGFFSYSREDDEDSDGALSTLRDRIQRELRGQLGRSMKNLRLWQDKEAIASGKLWAAEIETAVAQAVFFIPIITPTVVRSRYCRIELEAFLSREAALGRDDLVFPILYIRVPELEDSDRQESDPVISIIAKRQYLDWRELRHRDANSPVVKEAIDRFCANICDALNRRWLSPEERKQQDEAQALRLVEAKRQNEEAEAKRREEEARQQAQAQQRAEQERRQREAEAEQRANAEAARRAEEERRRGEAAAEKAAAEKAAAAKAAAEKAAAEKAAAERAAAEAAATATADARAGLGLLWPHAGDATARPETVVTAPVRSPSGAGLYLIVAIAALLIGSIAGWTSFAGLYGIIVDRIALISAYVILYAAMSVLLAAILTRNFGLPRLVFAFVSVYVAFILIALINTSILVSITDSSTRTVVSFLTGAVAKVLFWLIVAGCFLRLKEVLSDKTMLAIAAATGIVQGLGFTFIFATFAVEQRPFLTGAFVFSITALMLTYGFGRHRRNA